ncbi:MTMR5 protein, partial [Poecile atricapillus]|nr:MTMR5 protein [Poecile atricapillus]
ADSTSLEQEKYLQAVINSMPHYSDAGGRNTLSGFTSAHMSSAGEGRGEGARGAPPHPLQDPSSGRASLAGVWEIRGLWESRCPWSWEPKAGIGDRPFPAGSQHCLSPVHGAGDRLGTPGEAGVKPDPLQHWELVPIEVFDVRQVKASFKKLMKACVPGCPSSDPSVAYLRSLEESEWLSQV